MKYFMLLFSLISYSAYADSKVNPDSENLMAVDLISKTETNISTQDVMTLELDLGGSIKDKVLNKISKLSKIKQVQYVLVSDDKEYPVSSVTIRLTGAKNSVQMIASEYK
jgi:hypothetical protein